MAKKASLTKTIYQNVYKDGTTWNVQFGELKRHQANPGKAAHLFRVIGEKLPYAALKEVRKHLVSKGFSTNGIYMAHDSMGVPRYVGRGNIFVRLQARLDAQKLELSYFSFYIILEKNMNVKWKRCLSEQPVSYLNLILVKSV